MCDSSTIKPLDTPLSSVPFTNVHIQDRFWSPKIKINRDVSIPISFDQLEKSNTIRNFELAAQGKHDGYSEPLFRDSDLYKAIEAAAYSLSTHPDQDLESKVDEIIEKIAAAQMLDGYLDTYFQVLHPDKRWTNLRDAHELYCAGHLFEAAIAYYKATGKRKLLDVAIKLADHIDRTFGTDEDKRMGYPGHPEIELALIKLWKVTGEKRYFNLSKFFVDNRGSKFYATEHNTPLDNYDGTYWQDDVPIREHNEIKGHAVRAAYLMAGVTDIVAETHDRGLLDMMARVWDNTTLKRLYVTGGIGPSAHNEGFTTDYDLPNRTAYQETCASVALMLWGHRLTLLTGDTQYYDAVERALFNGFLAGVSLDGSLFFYDNPLASYGNHHRSEWFGCACCPPNVTRTLASLGEYLYAVGKNAIYVNLYAQGSMDVEMNDATVRLEVETDYPWDGNVIISVHPAEAGSFSLMLRIPGWCKKSEVKINGALVNPDKVKGYLELNRYWRDGDNVELSLEMPVIRLEANPLALEDAGRLATQRGPIIYCMEACDQSVLAGSVILPENADIKPVPGPAGLDDVVALKGNGLTVQTGKWENVLYRPVTPPARVQVTLIPYYAWDNRAPGAMFVWLPR